MRQSVLPKVTVSDMKLGNVHLRLIMKLSFYNQFY